MADEATFRFEFVDSSTSTPASTKPGGQGAAPPSTPASLPNAVTTAQEVNDGAKAPRSPAPSGATPGISLPALVTPTTAPTAPTSPASPSPSGAMPAIVDAAGKALPGLSAGTAGSALKAASAIGSAALPALGAGASVVLPFMLAAGAARAIQGAANTAIAQVGDLSPEVARAQAMDEVRQLRANIRTGERLGDELSDNIEVRGRLSDSLQTIRDAVTEPLLGALNDVMEALVIPLELIADNSEAIKIGVDGALAVLIGADSELRELRRQMKKDKEMSFLDWFEKQPQVVPAGFNAQGQMEVVNLQFNAIPGLNL